ncbi:MAG: hypothetical protein AB1758_20275 [Candidatus Eremiobacterota bacterium]
MTGAVVIRPGARYFEGGQVTPRFQSLAEEIRSRFDKAFEELAR